MIEKLNNVADVDKIINKLNEIIDVLNQYEKDRIWTAKEFKERLKDELYQNYKAKVNHK